MAAKHCPAGRDRPISAATSEKIETKLSDKTGNPQKMRLPWHGETESGSQKVARGRRTVKLAW